MPSLLTSVTFVGLTPASIGFLLIVLAIAAVCVAVLIREHRQRRRHPGSSNRPPTSDAASGGSWGLGPADSGGGGEGWN